MYHRQALLEAVSLSTLCALIDNAVQNLWLNLWLTELKIVIKGGKGAQWLSGRVLDSRPRGGRFEPHQRHCIVVLEQDTFILAKYWFNPGRPVPV